MSGPIKQIKTASMAELSPVLLEVLATGSAVRLTVTGGSMYPFLRHCQDSVVLQSPREKPPARGDIVLVRGLGGRCVLHRMVKLRNGRFYMLGDAQRRRVGPYPVESILGVVTGIYRNESYIGADELRWRALSSAWLLLRPCRGILLSGIVGLSKLRSRL